MSHTIHSFVSHDSSIHVTRTTHMSHIIHSYMSHDSFNVSHNSSICVRKPRVSSPTDTFPPSPKHTFSCPHTFSSYAPVAPTHISPARTLDERAENSELARTLFGPRICMGLRTFLGRAHLLDQHPSQACTARGSPKIDWSETNLLAGTCCSSHDSPSLLT